MKVSRVLPVVSLVLASAVILASGCGRTSEDQSESVAPGPAEAPVEPAPVEPAPVVLEDVVEHDPRYLIGISYPPGAAAHPGLARVLYDYAQAAREELKQAVEGLDSPPTAPYELSLGFRTTLETSQVIAVAADGSLYTGGAHGQPLVARFVWLPRLGKVLEAGELVPTAAGWDAISDYVAEKLGEAAHTRAVDESLEPADRKRLLSVALKMIAEGTEAKPENFSQFEPVKGADGHVSALRFVFAPYQVGPYADGIQEVEVPASVLLPHVAEQYRDLFSR